MKSFLVRSMTALIVLLLGACATDQGVLVRSSSQEFDFSLRSVRVTYQDRPSACQGQSKFVTWIFEFKRPIPAESVVLSLVNHQGTIELRNIKNTGSMSTQVQNSELAYSYCAPIGWQYKYPVRIIETKSGVMTDMLTVEVRVLQ
jgi:hypothetical protein